mgnify:CR=1 FL=1
MSSESQYLASKYKCKCNTTKNGTTKNANLFSGNTNKPTFLVTDPFLLSTIVRTSRFSNGGKTVFANRPVNYFGSWTGAPGGSGSPPRNTF